MLLPRTRPRCHRSSLWRRRLGRAVRQLHLTSLALKLTCPDHALSAWALEYLIICPGFWTPFWHRPVCFSGKSPSLPMAPFSSHHLPMEPYPSSKIHIKHDSLLSLSSFLGAISLTFIFSKLYSHFSRVTFHTPTLLFLHVCSKLLACKLLGGKAYG